MSKIYAIRKGKFIGKVYSWEECQEAIKGYSSAEYKSFKNEADADAYLKGEDTGTLIDSSGKKIDILKPKSDDVVNLFCTGGYKEGKYSYGIYLEGSCAKYLDCGTFNDDSISSGLRSIFGQCVGCLAGLQLASSLGFKRINVYCDYECLVKWVDGTFKPKSKVAFEYLKTYKQILAKYGVVCRFFYTKGNTSIKEVSLVNKLSTRARKQNIVSSSDLVWNLEYSKYNAQFQNPSLFL